MKTLQECKDEVCLRKHNHYFIMRHRRSIDELMAITDEAAELYASQFREPSTEQSEGTEQEEDSTEFVLTNFLLWVEMETTYFEDKDVTPTQVVQAYLNTIHTRKP